MKQVVQIIKKDIKLFINYYEKQAQKYHLNIIQEEATYDTIVNGGYDACIIATGGKPRTLDKWIRNWKSDLCFKLFKW